jgi:hypothetical protein
MSRCLFQSECPGTFGILSRTVSEADCGCIALDYEVARQHGGNAEPATKREEGVSFNPRLGRIVSILIQDGGIRDSATIRVALYASVDRTAEELAGFVPEDLLAAVLVARSTPAASLPGRAIQLAWALDAIRHLHMSDLPVAERADFLRSCVDPRLLSNVSHELEPLATKVRHALTLQERRLLFDGAGQGRQACEESSLAGDVTTRKDQ